MAKQSVYKLDGKLPEDVRQSFVHYMGDKNATSKQIKDAANSRYVKIDTISVIRSICKKQFGVDNIYEITDAGRISNVSDALTSLINAGGEEGEVKELKNTRSYVNKYRDFLTYCANLSEETLDSTTPYDFADDPDKPFIAEEKFNEIVELLFRKKNIILQKPFNSISHTATRISFKASAPRLLVNSRFATASSTTSARMQRNTQAIPLCSLSTR